MPNILDRTTAEKMVQRVQRLTPDTQPLWGSMAVTEMLLHCNKIQEQLLIPATSAWKKTSLKQYILRCLVLYIMPNFPKNARAPKQVQTKGLIDSEAFYDQQQRFIENVLRFPAHTSPIEHRHPYFGNLNTRQWGIACWKHNDHHLRQFGV